MARSRADKIRRMERTLSDYERNNPGSTKKVASTNDQAGFFDKAAGAVNFLRGEARRIKSSVQTKQKLQAKRGARYVKTMRSLKGD